MRALGLLLGLLALALPVRVGASICGDYRTADLRDCMSAYDDDVGDCYFMRALSGDLLHEEDYYGIRECLAEALDAYRACRHDVDPCPTDAP